MLFMDWRDDHTLRKSGMHQRNMKTPTFLYAMPFSEKHIFLEETSLVARPAVEFGDLKERLDARMEWLGIKVGSLSASGQWANELFGANSLATLPTVG